MMLLKATLQSSVQTIKNKSDSKFLGNGCGAVGRAVNSGLNPVMGKLYLPSTVLKLF